MYILCWLPNLIDNYYIVLFIIDVNLNNENINVDNNN